MTILTARLGKVPCASAVVLAANVCAASAVRAMSLMVRIAVSCLVQAPWSLHACTNVNGGGRAMPAASVVAALRCRRVLTRFAPGCYRKGPHRGSALQSQDNTIDWVTRARELVPVIAAGADRAERD